MEFLENIIHNTTIDTPTIIFRLVLSFIIGAVVGFEREKHKRPAGLRTHILICVGSTLFMLISIYIPQTFQNFQNGDPGRIAAQVVTGIGFIGAGAIMKFGVNIKGLTTAASIWVMASLGLAVGAGLYMGVIIGVILLLFALTIMDKLEDILFVPKYIKRLNVYTETLDVKTSQITDIVKRHNIAIQTVDVEQSFEEKYITYYLTVQISEKVDINQLNTDLSSITGVKRVKLQQII